MKNLLVLACLLLSGLLHADESAEPLQVWTLLDQFEQAFTFDDQVKILLVARSMDAADILKQALQGQPKGFLEARQAVFVADVSGMPTLISTLFAMPAMRKYNYRVMIDHQPRVVPRYSGSPDKLLWLQLDQRRVQKRQEFSSAAELRQALEQAGK